MAEKINKMLYPNCSETVFRLSGDFENIRTQMFNIVEWTRKEYTGEVGDGEKEKLDVRMVKGIADINKKIKEATSLEDFEQIVIEFTCNYETFFKKEDDKLLVATCNNYEWTDVDAEEIYNEDDYSYYDVAGYTHYTKACKIDGYEIYKMEYQDTKDRGMPEFVFPEKGFKITNDDYGVKFVVRGDIIFSISDNHLEKIPQVTDKIILTKLKLLMNLDSSTLKEK